MLLCARWAPVRQAGSLYHHPEDTIYPKRHMIPSSTILMNTVSLNHKTIARASQQSFPRLWDHDYGFSSSRCSCQPGRSPIHVRNLLQQSYAFLQDILIRHNAFRFIQKRWKLVNLWIPGHLDPSNSVKTQTLLILGGWHLAAGKDGESQSRAIRMCDRSSAGPQLPRPAITTLATN